MLIFEINAHIVDETIILVGIAANFLPSTSQKSTTVHQSKLLKSKISLKSNNRSIFGRMIGGGEFVSSFLEEFLDVGSQIFKTSNLSLHTLYECLCTLCDSRCVILPSRSCLNKHADSSSLQILV